MEKIVYIFGLIFRFFLFLLVTLIPFITTGLLAYYSVMNESVLIATIVISAVLIIYSDVTILLYKRKNEKAALFWVIFVTVLPIFGPLFYIMYGNHYVLYDDSLNKKTKPLIQNDLFTFVFFYKLPQHHH